MKSVLNYYKSGFILLNKNLYIFWLTVIFSLISAYKYFPLSEPLLRYPFLGILNFIGMFTVLTFLYIKPILFADAHKNQFISKRKLIPLFLITGKKVIPPLIITIVLSFLVFAVIFLFGLFINAFMHVKFSTKLINQQLFAQQLSYPLIIFLMLQRFQPILVTLSNISFYKALVISPVLFLKHIKFTFVVMVFLIFNMLLNQLINSTLANVNLVSWSQTFIMGRLILQGAVKYLLSLLIQYVELGIFAAHVLYFKDNIQPTLSGKR